MKIKTILKRALVPFLIALAVIAYYPKTTAYAEDSAVGQFIKAYMEERYSNIVGSSVGSTGHIAHGVVDSNQGWVIYGIDVI